MDEWYQNEPESQGYEGAKDLIDTLYKIENKQKGEIHPVNPSVYAGGFLSVFGGLCFRGKCVY